MAAPPGMPRPGHVQNHTAKIRTRYQSSTEAGNVGLRALSVFLPDLSGGGAERAMIDLAAACQNLGDDVELVVARPGGSAEDTVPASIPIRVLGGGRTAGAARALAGYLAARRPRGLISALTHANMVAIAAASAARSQTRVVVCEHANIGYVLGQLPPGRAAAYRRLIRTMYRRAAAVVAVSGGTADALSAATGLARSAVHVVPNIVDAERIRRAAYAGSAAAPDGPPMVVALGRLEPVKGFDVLLRAFAQLRAVAPARLVIAGEGPLRDSLAWQARDLEIERDVEFPGFVPDPYRLLGQAAVVALSSRSEALPTVILEAFALGIPVVATDCPTGPGELLTGSIGRLVPVGDAGALGDALAAALRGEVAAAPPAALDRYRAARIAAAYRDLAGTAHTAV